MLEENREVVARVAKTFGANGELTLNLFGNFPQDFDPGEPLFVVIDSLAVPLFFDRFQRRGQRGAVVTFGDIDTERRAQELVGRELFLTGLSAQEEEEADDDGRIYLEDLVGYTVLLAGVEKSRGSDPDRIEEFIDGENPLLRATIGGREVLIPAVEEFIAEIDTEQKTIEFDLPDGLLELFQE